MPNGEQQRADLAKSRGKQAAGMLKSGASLSKTRSFIAEQGSQESEARRINATVGKSAGYKTDPVSTIPKKSHPGLDF
jgi:hypothetical protein